MKENNTGTPRTYTMRSGNPDHGVGFPNTMITPAKHRILSFALALCLLLAMTLVGPVTVSANVGIADGRPPNTDIEAYKTVIGFAGQEWYVIGYNDTGVEPDDEDYVILLLKTGQTGSRPYTASEFGRTQIYNGSTLYGAMQGIYDDSTDGLYQEAREQALVVKRTLDGVNNNSISGGGNQILPSEEFVWPLSEAEYGTIRDATKNQSNESELLAYSTYWWLRSPARGSGALVGDASGAAPSNGGVHGPWAVRPAFQLNLESVIFTSDAAGGKSVTVGAPALSEAEPSTGSIKLTVKDNVNLGLNIADGSPITAASGEQVDIDYTDAKTGAGRSVSVIIADNSGTPLFYGRPVDTSSGNANGTASFDLPAAVDLPDGNYKLLVFNEEVNGANKTDFASTPKEITLTVSNPTANLSVANIDFGVRQENGPQTGAQNIAITNNGDADATVTKVSLTGNNAGDFSNVPRIYLPYTLSSNRSVAVAEIQPKPNLPVGDYEATIEVEYTGGPNGTDITTGTVKFKVEAASPPGTANLSVQGHNFGTVSLGYSQPAPEPIAIANNGDADGTVTEITLTGSNAGDFNLIPGDTEPFVIPDGDFNDTWMVQPADDLPAGTYSATVNVKYSGGSNPSSNTETATVRFKVEDGGGGNPSPGQPYLTASPPQLSFGTVEVGDWEKKTVTVTGEDLTGDISYSITGSSAFSVSPGSGWSDAVGGDLEITFSPDAEQSYNATLTLRSSGASNVTVPLTGAGVPDGEDGNGNGNGGNNGGGSSSSGSRRSSSGGSSTPDARVAKTTLPASAFSWDGGRTLTINHDSITPLGLLRVDWDGTTLTRGTDFDAYQGSVIVRFSEDFMVNQAPGAHTVRVEFLNHTGEATVTVDQTGTAAEPDAVHPDNETHNPNTGGDSLGSNSGVNDNPNTGAAGPGSVWVALMIGSLGAAVLTMRKRKV